MNYYKTRDRNFQDTFQTHKQSFINSFATCMAATANYYLRYDFKMEISRKMFQKITFVLLQDSCFTFILLLFPITFLT